jgi:hypothetical protein
MQDSCPCLTHSRRSDSRSRICRDSLISRHAWRPKRSRIPVSGGAYLLWASPGGEQVWLQVDADNYFVGMTPHFAGKSQVSVSVRSIVRRPGETFLDGTIRGWVVNETAPTAGILDYPIVVDVPNLATHGRLEIPICVDVQVAAFAREVSTFASEDAYYASQEPGGSRPVPTLRRERSRPTAQQLSRRTPSGSSRGMSSRPRPKGTERLTLRSIGHSSTLSLEHSTF